jgi:hypothetical protein
MQENYIRIKKKRADIEMIADRNIIEIEIIIIQENED